MVCVTANNLGRKFGDRWVFRRLEFSLAPNDVLLVTGRNGSGKSTLLKVIAGLVMPSEGSSEVPGSFGYSALDLAVYPVLSATEHLEFTAKLRGCPARSAELLDQVGLQTAAGQRAGEFSTGMRARLKLAMAIQHQPQLLMLDEPSAAMDEQGREVLAEILADFQGAVIIATNDKDDGRYATLGLHLD